MKKIAIDPKIFISAPYTTCPKCKKPESFGLLMVNSNNYQKRCKECWHTEGYPLPVLDKKVIYLDQFVISNMMKAVNDRLGKKESVDPFYLALFERLSRLCKLQVLICPDSEFHENESNLSKYSTDLKRMYEHLSHGITFYDSSTIRRFVLCDEIIRLHNSQTNHERFNVDRILHGDMNEWQDKILVSIDRAVDPAETQRIRQNRIDMASKINALFEIWRKETNKQFDDWFNDEVSSYGPGIFRRYSEIMGKVIAAPVGSEEEKNLLWESALSDEHLIVFSMIKSLPSALTERKKYDLAFNFLVSAEVKQLPFVKIMAAIFASLAHEVAHSGRKREVGPGAGTDIYMVSSILPYCDAIFVDNEIHRLLSFSEAKSVLPEYQDKIFSLSNKQSFLDYLDKMFSEIPDTHKDLVTAVYGKNWDKAYLEMYSD